MRNPVVSFQTALNRAESGAPMPPVEKGQYWYLPGGDLMIAIFIGPNRLWAFFNFETEEMRFFPNEDLNALIYAPNYEDLTGDPLDAFVGPGPKYFQNPQK